MTLPAHVARIPKLAVFSRPLSFRVLVIDDLESCGIVAWGAFTGDTLMTFHHDDVMTGVPERLSYSAACCEAKSVLARGLLYLLLT